MYRMFLESANNTNRKPWEEFYSNSGYGVDADRFAKAAPESLPDVEALLQPPQNVGVVFAFDPMKFLAAEVHGELEIKGGCGYGDIDEPYALMDAMMMRVITRRLQQQEASKDMAWIEEVLGRLQGKRDHIAEYSLEG